MAISDPISDPRKFLSELFDVAVKASVPQKVLGAHMPVSPRGKTIIIGAGKASAQMALAFENLCVRDVAWNSEISGLVVTQYGAGEVCEFVDIVEAAHPVPDAAGENAARRMLEIVQKAGSDDLVVALISGGGSSLLALPCEGLDLGEKQEINRALLASGAPISAMNIIRKMFSGVKGGRLGAAAYPAKLLTLVISDVPGDDPAMVASGPTIASIGGFKEAKELIAKYGVRLPEAAAHLLADGTNLPPMPNDEIFSSAKHRVIASAQMSLDAAAKIAHAAGCEILMLSDAIEGEAQEIGRAHGRLIKDKILTRPLKNPLLILSGGETSVTIKGGFANAGKGGRNSEYLLALALEIEGVENVFCLAADTDGRDGSENNAGAFCDGGSIARMTKRGMRADKILAGHDAWTAFEGVDDLLVTGPTGTNVNDFRALLIV